MHTIAQPCSLHVLYSKHVFLLDITTKSQLVALFANWADHKDLFAQPPADSGLTAPLWSVATLDLSEGLKDLVNGTCGAQSLFWRTVRATLELTQK